MSRHASQQAGSTCDVGIEVLQRDLKRLVDGLSSREVNYGVNVMRVEDPIEACMISQVEFMQCHAAAGEGTHGTQGCGRAVGEVVYDDHLGAGRQQLQTCVTSNEARSASNERRHK
jgi:hypothetical protein